MPLAFATCSAPARTALAIGLPALLVKMARVSGLACESPQGTNVEIAAANSGPWRFIVGLPSFCWSLYSRCGLFRRRPGRGKLPRTALPLADRLAGRLDHVRRRLEHTLNHTLQGLAVDRRDFELQLLGFSEEFGVLHGRIKSAPQRCDSFGGDF